MAVVLATTEGELFSSVPKFSYESVCDYIGFEGVDMKTEGGEKVDVVRLPTCVTSGLDGKFYSATLEVTVHVFGYKPETFTMDSYPYFKNLLDNSVK